MSRNNPKYIQNMEDVLKQRAVPLHVLNSNTEDTSSGDSHETWRDPSVWRI